MAECIYLLICGFEFFSPTFFTGFFFLCFFLLLFQYQLSQSLGANVPLPQVLFDNDKNKLVLQAAVGKSHTLLLMQHDRSIHAVGSNKSGQCGFSQGTQVQKSFKQSSIIGHGVEFAKLACGEDFSCALSTEGDLYTTGSSEFGQLGTGETGEYFISANKLAFANAYAFEKRTRFVEAAGESVLLTDKTKLEPIEYDMKFQDIACGRHHTVLLEAPHMNNDTTPPKVLTWGCGNYGCLGHGQQTDEYYPRVVTTLPRGLQMEQVQAGSTCTLVLTAQQGHVYYFGKHKSSSEAKMRPQLVDELAHNQHVVSHLAAGTATVACCTNQGSTVVWGQGPVGELGLSDQKRSSAKPTFVDTMEGVDVLGLACGQGSMLFIVDDTSKNTKKLPIVDRAAVEDALEGISQPLE